MAPNVIHFVCNSVTRILKLNQIPNDDDYSTNFKMASNKDHSFCRRFLGSLTNYHRKRSYPIRKLIFIIISVV